MCNAGIFGTHPQQASEAAMAALSAVLVHFLAVLSAGWCQTKFDCPALPPLAQPARTVYELKPQDIKVVMALGDSVTAGRLLWLELHEVC